MTKIRPGQRWANKFQCVVCGKVSMGRQPHGEGTIIYPRRHKDAKGNPCPGNIQEAKYIAYEVINGRQAKTPTTSHSE